MHLINIPCLTLRHLHIISKIRNILFQSDAKKIHLLLIHLTAINKYYDVVLKTSFKAFSWSKILQQDTDRS